MERYKPGQYVRTTKDKGSGDWEDNDRARRRPWGVCGKVMRISDSHGLIYEVLLDNGRIEWYEHDELEAA